MGNAKNCLIGTVSGLLLGALFYLVQPVQWKGEALVKIGQMTQDKTMESAPTVIERLKTRSFVEAVAQRAKRNDVSSLLYVEEKDGLSVKPMKDGITLKIAVVGDRSELVRISIDSVVSELIDRHDEILKSYQQSIRKELEKIDSEIEVLSKRMDVMDKVLAVSRNMREGGFALSGAYFMTIQHDMDFKLAQSSRLRETLFSSNARSSSLMEPVSIYEKRMISSLWRACFFGAFSGVLLALLWNHSRKQK